MTVIRSDGVSKFWLYMFVATVSGNINVNLNAKLKWHGNKATVPTRAEKKKEEEEAACGICDSPSQILCKYI